ncbi:DNA-binding transcriptional regulator BolA-like isoform X2 [Montipora foliosa]|uniref:DNA-binding transcriptional regulator BolA-like isoform X2 n=1 Tax=Montipora foliosa TaxID=591990 RepID=UPI0035F21821
MDDMSLLTVSIVWAKTLHSSLERRAFCRLFSRTFGIMTSVQDAITQKLTKEFEPVHLDVMNESYMHNVPKGSETHFKVVVVSETFHNKPLIQRHRMVMDILKQELETGVHALSIQAKTPQQWESSGGMVPRSPPCLGGSAR